MKNKEQKSKRIKKVFSNASEVLHRWANQTQDEARSSNVFFKGKIAYSYGYHYRLGMISEYRGVKVAIINGEGYSNTTAKHIHWAYGACEGLMPVVKGASDDFTSKGIFNALLKEQDELVSDIMSTFNSVKVNDWQTKRFKERDSWIMGLIEKFNKKARDLKEPQLAIDLKKHGFIEYLNEHLQLVKQKTDAREAEKFTPEYRAKKEAEMLAKEAALVSKGRADIEMWRRFEKQSLTNEAFTVLGRGEILRVKDGTVYTSKGASVPLDHAVKLMHKILKGTAKSGAHIGPYVFTSANEHLIKIGCHEIALDEARMVLAPYMHTVPLIELVKSEV